MSENEFKLKEKDPSQLTIQHKGTLLVITKDNGELVGYITKEVSGLNSGYKVHVYNTPVSIVEHDDGVEIETGKSKVIYKK